MKSEKEIRRKLEKVRERKKGKINELFPINYSVLCEYELLLRWVLGETKRGERLYAM